MLEWLGAGSLMTAAGIFSIHMIREHRKKLLELEAFFDMISCIRDNIEHLMKPLPEIFQNYNHTYLDSCGFLKNVRETNLQQAWETYVFSCGAEAFRLIDEFIRNIGKGYRTEELRLCEYTLGRLRKLMDHVQADTANQLKLYKTVPMMFALSLILILI